MRTGNQSDGMYFFLFIIPVIMGFLAGELVRKRIFSLLVADGTCNQNVATFVGSMIEILIIISGLSLGFLLMKLG
jgi:hypothetical protein